MCFNPCYCGCGLGRCFIFNILFINNVSILVIVDVVWEVAMKIDFIHFYCVSILVIVDVVWEVNFC